MTPESPIPEDYGDSPRSTCTSVSSISDRPSFKPSSTDTNEKVIHISNSVRAVSSAEVVQSLVNKLCNLSPPGCTGKYKESELRTLCPVAPKFIPRNETNFNFKKICRVLR